MIIRKIEVKGAGKPAASLEFEKGLNVVAGASDTGKSYVVQCIQFILGASDVPKPISESAGYDFVEITFEESDGTAFRLQRKLVPKANTLLIEDGNDEVIVFKGKHRRGLDNLSNWFLNKLGLSDKLLLKGKANLTTQALTLRTLENIFVVDETRIVAAYSPLGRGQLIEKTLEMSFLRTLLTGIDDANAKELKVANESKAAIERKMTSLEELIKKLYPIQSDGEQEIHKIDAEIERLDEQLDEADRALNEVINLNQSLLDSRHALIAEISRLDDQQREDRLLSERFGLLRAKYISDRARLLGIEEAVDVFESYTAVACPTCGQAFQDETSDEEIDQIAESAKAEARKIDVQLRDLNETILELDESVKLLSTKADEQRRELEAVTSTINNDLKLKIVETNRIKARLYEERSELIKARLTLDARNKALAELGQLQIKANAKQNSYDADTFDSELNSLLKEIDSIMDRWGYPDHKPVTFSIENRDIVIGGKPRGHFGKGYRAVAFSAFAIGLLTTLSKTGRHPGFVVLDSPLTTYKQADKDRGETDESIEADMVYSFYRDLCDSYKDNQIIIFDNQEPDEDLRSMMKYEHFSKNRSVGRYGFFPAV